MKTKYLLSGILIVTMFNACRPVGSTSTIHQVSIEEQIGQMLLIGFRGMSVDPNSPIVQQIKAGKVGGVVLFDYDVLKKEFNRNIESPDQLRKLIASLHKEAKIPLFVSIDQEGGKVLRLKPDYGFPFIPSAYYLGQINDPDSTRYYAELNSQNLAQLGFNLNFSPVVDLDTLRDTGVIGRYERSFSKDPAVVTDHARIVMEAHNKAGVIPVLKHFPGHGSSQNDSHLGMTDVTETWSPDELAPYLLQEGLHGAIMTAHVFNRNIDPDFPATLSAKTISILRDSMHYRGVIISDDMQMKAIANEFGLEQAIILCINAGIDILCFGNNLDYDEQIADKFQQIVLDAIERGEIKTESIEASYERILRLKQQITSTRY